MIEDKTNKIINELLNELKGKYPDFRGIYLFGSRARGDFNEYSDYDLAMIFNRDVDRKLKNEVRSNISRVMIENDIIIDNPFLIYNDIIEPVTPLNENIKNEGIFYEAAR